MDYLKRYLLILIFCLTTIVSNAKNYYLSSSSGNDDYTSFQAQNPLTPWKSLKRLNIFFSNLEPGDSILLKKGDVFTDSIVVQKSGTAISPITIAAYGSGSLPIFTLPTLSGWTAFSNGVYKVTKKMKPGYSVIYQDGKPLIPMASSADCKDGNWWSDGVTLYYKPPSGIINKHKISVTNLAEDGYPAGIDLSNSSFIHVNSLEFYAMGIGIKTFETLRGNNSLTIENSKFSYCQSAILFMPDIGNNTNSIIKNCFFYRNQNAVRMYTTEATGHRRGQTHGSNINCKILDNEMAENGTIDGTTHWANGADFEAIGLQNAMNTTVSNNYIHDGFQIGIIIYNLNTRSSDNNIITRNRIFNNKKGGLLLMGDNSNEGLSANYAFNNNFISNNIFVNSISSKIFDGTITIYQGKNTTKQNYLVNNTLSGNSNVVYFPTSREPYFTIENNIFYNSGKYRFIQWSWLTKPKSLVMDYNLYYEEDVESFGFQLKKTLSLNSMHTLGLEIHSKVINPEFVDANSYNFHLKKTSPAIGAGVDVGLPFKGQSPDVGAFSFAADSSLIKSSQIIHFPVISDKTVGSAPLTLKATASSGLPVTYKILSGSGTLKDSVFTPTAAGAFVIEASQPGNEKYNPAPSVEQSFTIKKTDQSILFTPPVTKTFGDAPFSLTASTKSNLSITFKVVSGPATISGNQVTLTGAGTVTINAFHTGNGNFNAASTTQVFTVNKAKQIINFNSITAKVFGDRPFSITAKTSSALPISYRVLSGPAVILGSTVTINGFGTVKIEAAQPGNNNYYAATPITQSISISNVGKISQSINAGVIGSKTYGESPFALKASSSSSLPISFKVLSGPASFSNNKIALTGAGIVTLEFSQSGNEKYNPAPSVEQSFTVNKSTPDLKFEALPDKLINDLPFILEAVSKGQEPIEFISSNPSIISVSNKSGQWVATITGSGMATIAAFQTAGQSYNEARVERTLLVKEELTTNKDAIQLSTFPNPFTTRLNIEFTPIKSGPANLTVYDLQGTAVKTLFKGQAIAQELKSFVLDADGLKTGVYIVCLVMADKKLIKKVIFSRI